MEMSNESASSYIDEKQDERLDEHESRITRLERTTLVVGGYLIAEGSELVLYLANLI